MLKLIRAAACCKDDGLDGLCIAKAEVSVKCAVQNASARVTLSRKRLRVVHSEGEGGELTLYLMPKGCENAGAEIEPPKDCARLVVTGRDIDEYLTLSGDTNPIHGGERPVIPGLLLLLRLLPHQNVSAEARFYSPAYLGETLYVNRNGKSMKVYSDHKIILLIKEKQK